MIKDAVDFAEKLNQAFARRPEDQLTEPMIHMITTKFFKWNSRALEKFFEYVCENWTSFSPPNLGQLLKMKSAWQESVPDRPRSNAPQLEQRGEGFVGKEKIAKAMGALAQAMRIQNKGQGRKKFKAEMEKILNE